MQVALGGWSAVDAADADVDRRCAEADVDEEMQGEGLHRAVEGSVGEQAE